MKKQILFALTTLTSLMGQAKELTVNQVAPEFRATLHDGTNFDLAARKGQWTVLYFYPKAETPGCTKQACAFRDNIKKIRDQGAEVYGISTDTVEDQSKFHKHHHLNFPLIADPDGKVTELYKAKMPMVNIAKRHTFIIDPDLKLRAIDKNVDPAKDSDKVATAIAQLKQAK